MFARSFFSLVVAVAVGSSAQAQLPSDSHPLQSLTAEYRRQIAPLLETYCLDCHTSDSPAGSIQFDVGDSPEHVLAHWKTWNKAAGTQRLRQMPPEDSDQPTAEEREQIITWASRLQAELDRVEPFDPGTGVIRRLNRTQYNQTMRDLLGIDLDVAVSVGLSDDPTVFGYDSIATALDIPALLMEKYVSAADLALAHAVDTHPAVTEWKADAIPFQLRGTMPEDRSKDGDVPPPTELAQGFRLFRVDAEMQLEVEVSQPGPYRIRLHGWGHKGPNWVTWKPDLAVGVNGQVQKAIQVLPAREKPGESEVIVELPAGKQMVTVSFINAVHGPRWANNDHRFRHLGVSKVELTGPVNRFGVKPSAEAHGEIFFVEPSGDLNEREAARRIIERFATRAYRRPVETDEIDRLLTLFDLSQDRGANFESSVLPMLKAVLISPHFLFRIESPAAASTQLPHAIADHELATRLSYFLWGTMPDPDLAELARLGQLSGGDTLRQQVDRMLDDPRSAHLVEDFAAQWLHLDELDHALPSEEFFPEFTAQARSSMRREVLMFFEHLIHENRSVIELIDADYTFGNRHLTQIYRMGSYQHEMQRFEINKRRDPHRGGLLGMGGILAMTSHVSRNSPTRRGKWILDVMLGDPPPPPPANVEQIDEASDLAQAKSFRELLDLHASDASCAGCHRKMDPLGFALDNFDPIGRYERERQGKEVDAVGILPGGRKIEGPIELKKWFLENKDRFVRNLAEQLLIYALGRRLEYYDQPVIARIVERTKADDYRMRTLITSVVESYPFGHRRSAEEPLLADRFSKD